MEISRGAMMLASVLVFLGIWGLASAMALGGVPPYLVIAEASMLVLGGAVLAIGLARQIGPRLW